jgi:hypothetical protein
MMSRIKTIKEAGNDVENQASVTKAWSICHVNADRNEAF